MTKMTRTRAITFFAAIGFPKAEEWDDAKLIHRLSQVPSRVSDQDVPTSAMPVYDELREAPTVQFIREPGEPAPKAARPSRAKPPTDKTEPERDKDGAAHGTIRAAVNAVLSVAWKTDKKIAKDAGVGLQQTRRWLRKIIQDGKVEKRNQIIYRLIE